MSDYRSTEFLDIFLDHQSIEVAYREADSLFDLIWVLNTIKWSFLFIGCQLLNRNSWVLSRNSQVFLFLTIKGKTLSIELRVLKYWVQILRNNVDILEHWVENKFWVKIQTDTEFDQTLLKMSRSTGSCKQPTQNFLWM